MVDALLSVAMGCAEARARTLRTMVQAGIDEVRSILTKKTLKPILTYISPISPPYLPDISPISPLYLRRISQVRSILTKKTLKPTLLEQIFDLKAGSSNPNPNPNPSPSPSPNPNPIPRPYPNPNPHPSPCPSPTLTLTPGELDSSSAARLAFGSEDV